MQITDIDNLYSYSDGDVITPGMGVNIAAGHSLAQFYDPATKTISPDSDFTVAANQPTIYPLPYSSKKGTYIVPATTGQQWYYNNLQVDSAGILDASGNVKTAFASLFQKTTYTLNGKTYPALKIKGNLCSENDQTNKTIYYVSTYNGTQIVCKIDIPVNVSVGTPFNVVVSCVNSDGDQDYVMDVDGEYLRLTSQLNANNTEVQADTYKWQRLVGSQWTDIANGNTSIDGELAYAVASSGKQLTVYDAGLNGIDNFRAVCIIDGKTYTKTVTLSDTRDPFFIDRGRNTSGNFIRPTDSVTYTPVVYSRSTGESQTGWSFSYVLTDNDGTVIRNSSGSTFTVQGSEIEEHGSVTVTISALKDSTESDLEENEELDDSGEEIP